MRVLRWASRVWTGVLGVVVLAFGLLLGLRFLVPLVPSPRPALATTTPEAGALAVAPRTRLTLQFTAPMNPRSVEQAISLSPPRPLTFTWNQNHTTLTISPSLALQSSTGYRLQIGPTALSRWYRPLDEPFTLAFTVAPAPAVLAVFPAPNDQDVPLTQPISIGFSRAIVPTDTVGLQLAEPLLRFDPPLDGVTTWIDPSTALFRPSTPLSSGTRYTATLEAGLTDAAGGQLDRPYTWSFSTPAPALVARNPLDGADRVGLRTPLTLRFSQPFDPAAVQAALTISPTIQGTFADQPLPDNTQVVTFTPQVGWQPATEYAVRLAPGLRPIEGNLALPGYRWSFRSAPQPRIIGRFPGEGQVLPNNQDVRLIFNTPVSAEAVQQALRFEPEAAPVQVVAVGNEVRVGAALQAATAYTLTLAPQFADQNGVALSQPFQLRFQTAPAAPALRLPDVANHVLRLSPGEIGPRFERINLASLDIGLFPLDEPSAVRLLAFSDDAWRNFSPERYGLAPLRTWSLAFTDTLNLPVNERLSLSTDGTQPLPEGVYYLRLRAPDQLRADALVFVSDTTLHARQNGSSALVWATDPSGAPLEGVVVAAYRDGAFVQRGLTGATGLWRFTASGRAAPLVALSTDGALATFDALSGELNTGYRVALIPDRMSYGPGETVRVAGFVRTASGGYPTGGLRGTLALRSLATTGRVADTPLLVGTNGVISTTLALPRELAPGNYLLTAVLGSQLFTADILVASTLPDYDLAIDLPQTAVSGDPLGFTLRAALGSLPYANAPVTWTLRAERFAFLPEGFSTGEADQPVLPSLSGSGRTDSNGQLSAIISDTVRAVEPLRYVFEARAAGRNGALVSARRTVVVQPAQNIVGLSLPSQIGVLGQPIEARILVVDPSGAPVADAQVAIELLRLSEANANPQRAFSRRVRTDAAGAAVVELPTNQGGAYRLLVSATDDESRRSAAALPLWLTADDFNSWAEPSTPVLPLVSDQQRYRPGDLARLLIAAPTEPGAALVVVRRNGRIEADVRPLRPGGSITVAVKPGDPPLLPVEVVLGDGRSTTTLLAVASENRLNLTITSDAPAYPTGTTATLVITTTDGQGRGVAADVVLGLARNQRAREDVIFQPGESRLPPTTRAEPEETYAWLNGLRTDANGVLTTTVQLPEHAGDVSAQAWAADGTGRLGTARQTLPVTQPLTLEFDAPPTLRAGDVIELGVRVRNTSSIPQQARITLDLAGFRALEGQPTQNTALAPGDEMQLVVRAEVQDTPQAAARVTVEAPGIAPLADERAWQQPRPAAQNETGEQSANAGGVRLLREYLDPQTGQSIDKAAVRVGQLVRVRLTLIVTERLPSVGLHEALPGGFVLVDPGTSGFAAEPGQNQLVLTSSQLEAGIVEHTYTLQAIVPGRFNAPAPQVLGSDGQLIGQGNASQLTISR